MKQSKKIHMQNYIPLKVCAKRKPPSIGILYNLSNTGNKKYLHEICFPTIKKNETAAEIYKTLLKSEPIHLNPEIISEKQIIHIIEQIMSKYDIPKPIKNNAFVTNQENEMNENLGEDIKLGDNKRIPLKENNINTEVGGNNLEDDVDYDKLDEGMNNENLPEGFQRVFVEDLGQEVLMDAQGNLYDEDGNIIGQAASDDEGEAENNPHGEDDQYFDDVDLP